MVYNAAAAAAAAASANISAPLFYIFSLKTTNYYSFQIYLQININCIPQRCISPNHYSLTGNVNISQLKIIISYCHCHA